MTCSKCRSFYTAYKERELPSVLRNEVEEHTKTCVACRSIYVGIDRILETSSLLPRLRASEDLAESVLARILSSEKVRVMRVRRFRRLVPRLAYGVAVTVLTGVVGFLLVYGPGRRMSTPMAAVAEKERIYSLGPELRPSDVVVRESDYSLGHVSGPERIIYSLPARSTNARLASY